MITARSRVLLLAAIILLPFSIGYALLDQWPYLTDTFSRGQPLGRDAYNFWAAGHLALAGHIADIYDVQAFAAAQNRLIGDGIGFNAFLYPPSALPMFAAIAWLPYPLALALWTTLSVSAFVVAVCAPRFHPVTICLALIAPMTLFNVIMGQTGLICAALLIGGLRLTKSHPVVAGILIGLLSFKPILGLLLPLLLIARRQWPTFASATCTVLVMAALPALIWGWSVWDAFVTHALPLQSRILHHGTGIGIWMIPSTFNSVRMLGAELPMAFTMHAVTLILVAVLIVMYGKRTASRRQVSTSDILIVATSTVLLSPYIHNYDFSLLEGALILWAGAAASQHVDDNLTLTAIVILWGTAFVSFFLNLSGFPIVPPLILACLAVLAYRIAPTR